MRHNYDLCKSFTDTVIEKTNDGELSRHINYTRFLRSLFCHWLYRRMVIAQMISSKSLRKKKEFIRQEIKQLTTGEQRILRALLDEPNGRLITNYVKFYKSDLLRLIEVKKLVQLSQDHYYLTSKGKEIAQEYFESLLH